MGRGRSTPRSFAPPPARAAYRYPRAVSDSEFVQRVRRHTPSSLLPLIAAAAAANWRASEYMRPGRTHLAPWALAEIARVSLTHGTAFNRTAATEDDLLSCLAAYQAATDLDLQRQGDDALFLFMLRMADQLRYQQSIYNDMCRAIALMIQTEPQRDLEVLADGWQDSMLGCTLRDYVAVAMFLHTSAIVNAGRWSQSWLDQPNFDLVVAELPAGVIRDVTQRHFTATPDTFKELAAAAQTKIADRARPDLRRHTFNPLQDRPVIDGIIDTSLIPVPRLLVTKASPLGVYHAGVRWKGNAFARDLGHLFEMYVGRQLHQFADAEVHPEITYGKHSDQKSVDWFAVFDSCVLLIEVKSVRPTEPIRIGAASAAAELQRMLGKAVNQLNTTARLVRDGAPEFRAIPNDRPLLGLAVTIESFHVVNNFTAGRYLAPDSTIPWTVCSAVDLEALAELDDVSPGDYVLSLMTDDDKRGHALRSELAHHRRRRNPVLDEAWATLPWKRNPDVVALDDGEARI